MARADSSPIPALARPLSASERRELTQALARLLRWQRDLRAWPPAARAPAGTPIVSLYLDGTLRGCTGMSEGPPRERLARAFLQALADGRFGGVALADRGRLIAQVAYPIDVEHVTLARVETRLAPGVHGLVLSRRGEPPTVLLPDVARTYELDAAGFLQAMEHKVGLERAEWGPHRLYTFATETALARPAASRIVPARARLEPADAAIDWLAGLVAADGSVAFGIDPWSGERHAEGVMSHGRAAVVVQALASHSRGRAAAKRAHAWLEREIRRGLGGGLATFPREVPLVAGTLALARLAGIDCVAPLREIAVSPGLRAAPWHAAQVVCALGVEAPRELYGVCVNALENEPRAPWTALAARALGDHATHARVARTLAAWVPLEGPHAGGVGVGTLPEVALSALVVEALAGAKQRGPRAARARALAFILSQQYRAHVPPDITDPSLAIGAFPLTPVHAHLRGDVTAHAVLALASVQAD